MILLRLCCCWQEEAARKEDQERERRKKAEEKFKEWLENTDEKCKTGPKSPCYPRSKFNITWELITNTLFFKTEHKGQFEED